MTDFHRILIVFLMALMFGLAILFTALLQGDSEPVRDKPQEVIPGHHFVQE